MNSDPIADMLTRIRNGLRNGVPAVSMPLSKIKTGIAEVLVREGYLLGVETSTEPAPQGTLTIQLKYGPDGEQVIQTIDRFSKPGRRIYKACDDLPKPLNGLGISVVSTSQGIKSNRECAKERLGGEVLCVIW